MNAPIYNQAIHNGGDRGDEKGRGADATWLRAVSDLEHDDTSPALVYSAGPQEVARPPLTLIPTAVDEVDGDDCEASVCIYRSLYANLRHAQTGSAAADAVTHG